MPMAIRHISLFCLMNEQTTVITRRPSSSIMMRCRYATSHRRHTLKRLKKLLKKS
ncbi:MAG: hypothetical protein J5956_10445 [Ruminococcus sp.]|nr:hypothetical protein [Ruminococcus sp.]